MSLFAPGGVEDPYPLYARLRELSPVHHSSTVGFWVLTRFADCQQVLSDGANFLVVDEAYRDANIRGWRKSPGATFLSALLPWKNPPEHTRLRRLLTRDFTVRRVEALRPAVQLTADRLLDRLADECAGGAAVNFADRVIYPLGTAVIGELVGVPSRDHQRFRVLTEALAKFIDPEVDPEIRRHADLAAIEYREYFLDLIAKRRADPADDLTSALIGKHEADADQFSDDDVLNSLIVLFGGGYETTAGALGNGLNALLGDRAQYDLLANDPSLAVRATEEILRYDPPGQLGVRTAVGDTSIGGVEIPANTMVMILTGAANRDPARFSNPERFDIMRDEGRSLSFGHGMHLCLGAALARLEMTVLLSMLATRFPKLELAGPVVRRPGVGLRGVNSLPVRVNA